MVASLINGVLTERLGNGLQNRGEQFDSARYLTERLCKEAILKHGLSFFLISLFASSHFLSMPHAYGPSMLKTTFLAPYSAYFSVWYGWYEGAKRPLCSSHLTAYASLVYPMDEIGEIGVEWGILVFRRPLHSRLAPNKKPAQHRKGWWRHIFGLCGFIR